MAVALAGRAAEQVVFGEITTGARRRPRARSRATAKDMVMRFGMGGELGARVFGRTTSAAVRRSRAVPHPRNIRGTPPTTSTARSTVDRGRAYEAAMEILDARRMQLDVIARVLLERETLGRAEFEALLARTPPMEAGRVLRFQPRGPRDAEAARAS